jgi:UTP--glucose-1-phosphate uridylyltransferase
MQAKLTQKIRKAIIPVAGLGTRFLPATKAQPKEMLAVVDKPVIQFLVEEAVASGIEEIIFVTSSAKRAIEDHFDKNFELEYRLEQGGKTKELAEVRRISELATFAYVRQQSPKGDGHAILTARRLVGDEPCAVLFGDDMVDADPPCLRQLIDVYEAHGEPVIALAQVPKKDIHHYGCAGGTAIDDRTIDITALVEKPAPEEAPSDLAIIGKYIITPDVFDALERAEPSKGGEIRLIDGFRSLLGKRPIHGHRFHGMRYDCGNKYEFLRACVDYGLRHPEVNGDGRFAAFLAETVSAAQKSPKQ